jgi:DNA adenine methylase
MSDDLLKIFQSLGEDDDKNAQKESEIKTNREKYVRAPFGWPGGKYKELPKILPYLPYRDSYIEPFGGSGAILLARKSSPLEVYNDRYGGVVAFYRCLRDNDKWKLLKDRLEWCRHAREEFIWCKETWENCEDDVERAARWFYMISFSFSNMGKAFGRVTHSTSIIGTRLHGHLKDFEKIHKRLERIQIENLDFRTCLIDYDHLNSVFYLDAPYLNYSGDAYMSTFTKQDHIEMCEIVMKMKGFVAVSGYPNDLYNQYKWDNHISWERFISMRPANVQHDKEQLDRISHTECLWIKEAKV